MTYPNEEEDERYGPELGPWLANDTTLIGAKAFSYWNAVCYALSEDEYTNWREFMIEVWRGTRP